MATPLWDLKLLDGAEVSATLDFDIGNGATVTLEVRAAHGEDVLAKEIADALCEFLERRGAT